jgi:hypothetical protein
MRFAGLEIHTEGSRRVLQISFIHKLVTLLRDKIFEQYRSTHAKVAWCRQKRPYIANNIALSARGTKDVFKRIMRNAQDPKTRTDRQTIMYLHATTQDIALKFLLWT